MNREAVFPAIQVHEIMQSTGNSGNRRPENFGDPRITGHRPPPDAVLGDIYDFFANHSLINRALALKLID
jgi:hypothetical protein